MTALKRTPLYQKHLESHARMVEFGGWEMPVQYAGVIAEHLAVREAFGVFDVSHMGEFIVSGVQALEYLQFVTVNDASKLKVVYRLSEDRFLVVVNASNIEKDFAHMTQHLAGFSATLENHSDDWALIAAQGPLTAQHLEPHCTEDLSVKRKNSVFDTMLFGYPVRMARTGYTGEDGFEIFCTPVDAPSLWDKLLETGFAPCGLGARDTLRLEAGYPLYGHEWSDSTNPLETSLSWAVKAYKEFVGKDAMIAAPKTRHLLGLELLGRGIPREGYPVKLEGKVVGHVTSGTMLCTAKSSVHKMAVP